MDLQGLLKKYKINIDINMVLDMWNESHRYYHDLSHLTDLINKINETYSHGEFSEKFRDKLILTAIFHDVVYEPTQDNNEEKSSEFFLNLCSDKNSDIMEINEAILNTKSHQSSNPLSESFNKFDMNIVERDFDSLLNWEEGIFEEYKFAGDNYKIKRLQFLESLLDKYPRNSENLLKLINYVKNTY